MTHMLFEKKGPFAGKSKGELHGNHICQAGKPNLLIPNTYPPVWFRLRRVRVFRNQPGIQFFFFSFFLCVAASWREILFFISARKNLAGILTKLLTKCRINHLTITFSILPSPIDFHQPSTRVFDGEGMNLLGQRFLDEKMLSGCFLLFQVFC